MVKRSQAKTLSTFRTEPRANSAELTDDALDAVSGGKSIVIQNRIEGGIVGDPYQGCPLENPHKGANRVGN